MKVMDIDESQTICHWEVQQQSPSAPVATFPIELFTSKFRITPFHAKCGLLTFPCVASLPGYAIAIMGHFVGRGGSNAPSSGATILDSVDGGFLLSLLQISAGTCDQ